MATKIVTVSELKAHLGGIIARLGRESSPVYVTQYGKPKVVLVKYEEYEGLPPCCKGGVTQDEQADDSG